jgi:hypothetical protein
MTHVVISDFLFIKNIPIILQAAGVLAATRMLMGIT